MHNIITEVAKQNWRINHVNYETLAAEHKAEAAQGLAEDKTRILPFGRNSKTKDNFDFLGFTHVNSKTRNGQYSVGHLISGKKKKLFRSNLKKWVKEYRNIDFGLFMSKLNRKLIGTNNYYGISGTIRVINALYQHALGVTFKWINRRRQRKSFTFEKFYAV